MIVTFSCGVWFGACLTVTLFVILGIIGKEVDE